MNYTVVITLLITLIFPYIHCFVMLWCSYIDIIATLAISVNHRHANKVFVKKPTNKNPFAFGRFSATFSLFQKGLKNRPKADVKGLAFTCCA